ncbi:hypothetical protein HZH66_002977 [Vespula vulgaris]|uniref:Uncharacterized protein n=2 Tax=Vespula TaxID=7451 RepID=A0A834PBV7_VESPE|nr:hypothetical protein HZH66_002977 [Vespula vulgaris]KAF7435469.1 hypothetical protein H0235_003660 [Vespula pensylvanica]
MRPEFDDCVLETLRDYVTQPAHIREVSKGNSRRNVNDATNDSVGTDLPIFEPTAPNVTAFVGQTVYLPCRVRKLADKVADFVHTNAPDRAAFSKFLICALCFSRLVSRWCSGLDFSPQSSVPQRSLNYSAATRIKLPSVG